MRIISDFHDYYDAVQATGQDQSLIYFRKPEEIEVQEYPFPAFHQSSLSVHAEVQFQQHIIGFCGKIYPAIEVTCIATNKSAVCLKLDDLDSFFENNFRKKIVDEYRSKEKHGWRWAYLPWHLRRDAFEKYFAECADKKDSYGEMFLEKHCPVWIGTVLESWWRQCTWKITYNGCLRGLEFFRLFDTYSAYQEISMFLGGLAAPQQEIPHVPDKIMVGVKGFDQWSFRKPPGKKR